MGVRDGGPASVAQVLAAHAPYLSDADEAEIEARIASGADLADAALRTCLCGARIDGFDAYWAHLREVVASADSAT